jgi:hypothetical protein
MLGGMASTIAQGFAFGTGSAIAHRAVGAVTGAMGGGGASEAAPAADAGAGAGAPAANAFAQDCNAFQRDFTRCLSENRNDIASCQMYMDNFTQCERDRQLH